MQILKYVIYGDAQNILQALQGLDFTVVICDKTLEIKADSLTAKIINKIIINQF